MKQEEVKRLILGDAIEEAVRANTVIKSYKRWLCISIVINMVLVALLLVNL